MSKLSGIPTRSKNKNNLECLRRDVSEIKLKRTDTTLDLSQKAKRAKKKKKEALARGASENIYCLEAALLPRHPVMRFSSTVGLEQAAVRVLGREGSVLRM